MVDAPDSFEPQPEPTAPPAEKPASFLASTTGKIVIGGIALVVLLIILGVIAWVFLFSSPSSDVNTAVVRTVKPGASATTSASASASETAPIVEPQQKPLESSFTFRNIFAPTLKQPAPGMLTSVTIESSGTKSASSGSTANVPKDTLYLVSIQTVNGKKTATFIWNGQTYNLAVGQTIAGTPWKVLEIGDTSVVMLYGDTQVTLSTGQGLSK